ncbi:hypothetical protein AB9E19_13210 [Rhizobium leguminosarum]|uniref:hypothetical protein n=1 Tax=Rhizobium leguminosarum TaxID=384 RepID=UPI003F946DC6
MSNDPSFLRRLLDVSKKLFESPLPMSSIVDLDGPGTTATKPREAIQQGDYFSITINEMFLNQGRVMWNEYDPMVMVLLDFVYNRQRIVVPCVVGPATIKGATGVPHGTLLRNVIAAGPYPYVGGKVAVSLILYKVKTKSYATTLINFAENISKAVIGAGINSSSVETITKVGSEVVASIEGLLGLDATTPLAGVRFDQDANNLDGFVTSATVLLGDADTKLPKLEFAASGEQRLVSYDENGVTQPFSEVDYVVFSISKSKRRGDDTSLPFYTSIGDAFEAAGGGEDNWIKAKALLLSGYQQMLREPALTAEEGEELIQRYKQRLTQIKTSREGVMAMSVEGRRALTMEAEDKVGKLTKELLG